MSTLTDLDRLKAEHGPKFRAAAPKRREKGPLCWRFRCRSIKFIQSPAGLRLEGGWCKRQRCPRRVLEDYLHLLDRTEEWRHGSDSWSRAFWRDIAESQRQRVREALRG